MRKIPPQLTVCYEVRREGKATYSSADTELIINYMLDHDCQVGQAIAVLAGKGKIKGYPDDIGADDWYTACYCTEYAETK